MASGGAVQARVVYARTSVCGFCDRPAGLDADLSLALHTDAGRLLAFPASAQSIAGRRVWTFDTQWLRPLPVGTPVQVRMALGRTEGLLVAGRISAIDTKHSLHAPAHGYVLHYSPKSACTTLRRLFFHLHGDERCGRAATLGIEEAAAAFARPADWAPGFGIQVVRHPAQRLVSAFIDKMVSLRYAPALCTGHAVFRWRFGDDEARWGALQFDDFLAYLEACRPWADVHFQVQPCVEGDVERVTVETMDEALPAVYARRLPQLADRVVAFLRSADGHANPSVAGRDRRGGTAPSALTVDALAARVLAGQGIDRAWFAQGACGERLQALTREEAAALGYPPG